jgi:NADP-reducing hydrogenase subunit HndB
VQASPFKQGEILSMEKVRADDLERLRDEFKKKFALSENGFRVKIIVHMGTCGIASGAKKVWDAFVAEYEKSGRQDILLTSSGCAGFCSREPMVTVELLGEPPIKYIFVNHEKACEIFKSHVLGKKILKEYALCKGNERTM